MKKKFLCLILGLSIISIVVVTVVVLDPWYDFDGDLTPNIMDNCPFVYNLGQHDEDGDHVGDACDSHCNLAGKAYWDKLREGLK